MTSIIKLKELVREVTLPGASKSTIHKKVASLNISDKGKENTLVECLYRYQEVANLLRKFKENRSVYIKEVIGKGWPATFNARAIVAWELVRENVPDTVVKHVVNVSSDLMPYVEDDKEAVYRTITVVVSANDALNLEYLQTHLEGLFPLKVATNIYDTVLKMFANYNTKLGLRFSTSASLDSQYNRVMATGKVHLVTDEFTRYHVFSKHLSTTSEETRVQSILHHLEDVKNRIIKKPWYGARKELQHLAYNFLVEQKLLQRHLDTTGKVNWHLQDRTYYEALRQLHFTHYHNFTSPDQDPLSIKLPQKTQAVRLINLLYPETPFDLRQIMAEDDVCVYGVVVTGNPHWLSQEVTKSSDLTDVVKVLKPEDDLLQSDLKTLYRNIHKGTVYFIPFNRNGPEKEHYVLSRLIDMFDKWEPTKKTSVVSTFKPQISVPSKTKAVVMDLPVIISLGNNNNNNRGVCQHILDHLSGYTRDALVRFGETQEDGKIICKSCKGVLTTEDTGLPNTTEIQSNYIEASDKSVFDREDYSAFLKIMYAIDHQIEVRISRILGLTYLQGNSRNSRIARHTLIKRIIDTTKSYKELPQAAVKHKQLDFTSSYIIPIRLDQRPPSELSVVYSNIVMVFTIISIILEINTTMMNLIVQAAKKSTYFKLLEKLTKLLGDTKVHPRYPPLSNMPVVLFLLVSCVCLFIENNVIRPTNSKQDKTTLIKVSLTSAVHALTAVLHDDSTDTMFSSKLIFYQKDVHHFGYQQSRSTNNKNHNQLTHEKRPIINITGFQQQPQKRVLPPPQEYHSVQLAFKEDHHHYSPPTAKKDKIPTIISTTNTATTTTTTNTPHANLASPPNYEKVQTQDVPSSCVKPNNLDLLLNRFEKVLRKSTNEFKNKGSWVVHYNPKGIPLSKPLKVYWDQVDEVTLPNKQIAVAIQMEGVKVLYDKRYLKLIGYKDSKNKLHLHQGSPLYVSSIPSILQQITDITYPPSESVTNIQLEVARFLLHYYSGVLSVDQILEHLQGKRVQKIIDDRFVKTVVDTHITTRAQRKQENALKNVWDTLKVQFLKLHNNKDRFIKKSSEGSASIVVTTSSVALSLTSFNQLTPEVIYKKYASVLVGLKVKVPTNHLWDCEPDPQKVGGNFNISTSNTKKRSSNAVWYITQIVSAATEILEMNQEPKIVPILYSYLTELIYSFYETYRPPLPLEQLIQHKEGVDTLMSSYTSSAVNSISDTPDTLFSDDGEVPQNIQNEQSISEKLEDLDIHEDELAEFQED